MNQFKMFTGGVLDTNSFLYSAPGGNILFDAPQGSDAAFANTPIQLLLLTHGHFDHVADAAAIIKRHGCQVAFHPETASMVNDRDFFRRWGFELEIEPFQGDFLLEETPSQTLLGVEMSIYYVPGHSPGSLCFYFPAERTLVGGDVLFRGGVGRWDLPGGDADLLFTGIREKLFPLGDDVVVLPGHGPSTTIGHEKAENPFLAPR